MRDKGTEVQRLKRTGPVEALSLAGALAKDQTGAPHSL